jgi:hypothetical protein
MAFDSPATYVSFLQEVSGSIRRELAQRTAEEIARVWAGVASEASRYAEPDGSVRLVNKVRVVVGVR